MLQQHQNRLTPLLLAILLLTGCSMRRPEVGQDLSTDKAAPAESAAEPTQETMPEETVPVETEPPPLEEPVELARFCTPIHDWNENRINNINLACRAVEGLVIESGQTFSFNETVGRRTPERGYLESIIFVGEETELEVGGGICQLSTNLYNAALQAGLEVTEHHVHSRPVSYIEHGLDATVYYGNLDLQFLNNSGYALQLSTLMENGELTVSITALPA